MSHNAQRPPQSVGERPPRQCGGRIAHFFLCFCLIFEQPVFAQVAQSLDISSYFNQARTSLIPQDKFRPLHLRYISYDSQANDFKLLLDKGDAVGNGLKPFPTVEDETQELMNYFFVGLTLPNDKFWVNLRPDSPENIIDDDLAMTDIGRIFLEADVQLKKDTANFTSPQAPEGKVYWDKLYKKAEELFGTENITIPTITRPWIVPSEIIIRESPEGAYIYKATLKVMLEEDYLTEHTPAVWAPHSGGVEEVYRFSDSRLKELNEYSTQLIRELIIPKLTYQVNTSKRYAPLRQVYYSLILAQWFKQKYKGKETPYSRIIDSNNLTPTHNLSLITSLSYSKDTYFRQYQKSFQDGEYNLNEPVYMPSGQSIRRYVSGGIKGFTSSSAVKILSRGEMPKMDYLVNLYYDGQLAKASSPILKPANDFTPEQKKTIKNIINTYRNMYSSLSGNVDPEDIIKDMHIAYGWRRKLLQHISLGLMAVGISTGMLCAGAVGYEHYASVFPLITAGAFSVLSSGGMAYASLKRTTLSRNTRGWLDKLNDIYIVIERINTAQSFTSVVAHELAHKFNLPNDILLANAYAAIITQSSTSGFLMSIEEFSMLSAIEEFNGSFAQKEAITRKIMSDVRLLNEFYNANDDGKKRILNEVSLSLDYEMPRPQSESDNKWVYAYGNLLGMLIYFECGHDFKKSMEVLLSLGMARDVRDVDIDKIVNSPASSAVEEKDIEKKLTENDLNLPNWLGMLGNEIVKNYNNGDKLYVFKPIILEKYTLGDEISLSDEEISTLKESVDGEYFYIPIITKHWAKVLNSSYWVDSYNYKLIIAKKNAFKKALNYTYRDIIEGDNDILFLWEFTVKLNSNKQPTIILEQQGIYKDLRGKGFISNAYPFFVKNLTAIFPKYKVEGIFEDPAALKYFKKFFRDPILLFEEVLNGKIISQDWEAEIPATSSEVNAYDLQNPQLPAKQNDDGSIISSKILQESEKPGANPGSAVNLPSIHPADNNRGGIAFGALPIQTESAASSALGSFPGVKAFQGDLEAEWAQIQQVFNAGIRPSVQRISEYTLAVAGRGGSRTAPTDEKIDQVRGMLADILRREEEDEKLPATQPAVKKLLSALELR